ncbi:MAG: hypothetical protein QM478_07430 [Flavobacteriaceae bacterium]
MAKEIILGFTIAIFATLCGFFVYVEYVSELGFDSTVAILKDWNLLGKMLAIGAIPNLFVFMIFIKKQQDYRARGVLIATILIAVATFVFKFL